MCMPADSAYWVTLSCSSRAIRCRSLSSTSRCRAAPSSAWVSSSSSLRAFSSSACRVVRACSRAEWSSSAQFCRAAAVCPARIRRTEWSVSSISRSGGRPRDQAADDAAVEPDRHVQVAAARLGVVLVVVGAAAHLRPGARHTRSGRPVRTGPLGAVGAAHEVPRDGVGQLAVDQREHHPLGGQVVGRGLHDGPHQRLGALGGAHQRGRDPLQGVDHPVQPLRGDPVLGVVVRLARAQAGERLEVRSRPTRRAPGGAPRRPLRGGHGPAPGRRGGPITWPP